MSSHRLLDRIRDEYLGLPGLNLTFWQVQRLFAADETSSRVALDALVAEGFLHQTPARTFVLSWRVPRADLKVGPYTAGQVAEIVR